MAEWFDDETQQWYSTETAQWEAIEGEFLPPAEPVADYDAPGWKDIGFEFTSGGYTAPDFSAVSFQWFSTFAQTFNLGAEITGADYQQETYSAVKRRNIYALGYANPGWQILKGKTEYEGFRDLGGHLYGYNQAANLWAYILGKSPYEIFDLPAWIRGWQEADLGGIVFGIPPVDLGAYLHVHLRDYADLGGWIRAWHPRDLGGLIGAVHERDLPAILVTIQPKDLPAYLKAYPQEDLPAIIVGWAERDLGAFLKVDVRELANLGALIGVYVPRDLGATIKGWCYKSPFDLGALIQPFDFADLPAILFARPFGDLGGIIYGIPPKDLPAFLHGWQEVDLGGIIDGITDKQKDLIAFIAAVGGKDLPGFIRGWQAVDLGAILTPAWPVDLPAIINAIGGYIDLIGIINATGQAVDLGAIITPRLIKLAVLMPVHTMEYLDLGAVISLQPCFNQGIADLGARMIIFQKHDLIATIYGLGLLGANIRDLAAVIAVGDYIYDKDAVDDLTITFETYSEVLALDDLAVTWFDMVSPTDELSVCFKPGGGCKIPTNLLAAIIGHNPTFDLGAYINGVVQAPYIFGDPIFGPWDVDTLFTAPYIYNNRVLWERLVQISFFSQVYDYFYQSVSSSLWKDDNTEKWTLNVASWLEEETYLRDRISLREKVVGDVTEFESVDEAIRYAIDWVISFPTKDLGAQIQPIIPPYKDLAGRINPFKVYTKSANLIASITPFHTMDLQARMQIIDEWADLEATVTAT
jgi:hypothetical protein